jgi:hypothetical protein
MKNCGHEMHPPHMSVTRRRRDRHEIERALRANINETSFAAQIREQGEKE